MPPLRLLVRLPYRWRRKALRSRMGIMISLLVVLFILITPFYVIYKPPNLLIRYFQHRWPDVLWHVPTKSKVVALTIDDGPSEYTKEILQLLKANNATATFFVIGSQMTGREDILKDLVYNGNELGNHAMRDEPSRSLNDNILIDQIMSVEDKILKAYRSLHIDAPPKYFRPGSGFFSEKLRAIVARLGYHLVLGSIYPHDPQIPFWRVNANHILSMLRPGGIIICHDRRSWTVPMLQKVLPEIRRRGYRVVTISGLLQEKAK